MPWTHGDGGLTHYYQPITPPHTTIRPEFTQLTKLAKHGTQRLHE